MYNASNRKDIRRAEKAAKLLEDQRLEFVRAAMSTVQGRTYFHSLLAACHIFADPFSGDALREAYSKGERNVGLMVYMDIVNNCPDDFVRMMKEAQIKELTDERRSFNNGNGDTGDDDIASDTIDISAATSQFT